MALQLYPEPEDSRNRVFRDGSRGLIVFLILWYALNDPENCTLPQVYRDLANPHRLKVKLNAAQDSDALGGTLGDMADDIVQQMEYTPELFGSFRAGAIQQLAIFEPSGLLAESVSGSDVDLEKLIEGNTTIYLMMPTDRMASEWEHRVCTVEWSSDTAALDLRHAQIQSHIRRPGSGTRQ